MRGVQYPSTPHSLIDDRCPLISARTLGIFSSVFGGAALVEKNSPSFVCAKSVDFVEEEG